MGSLLVVVGQVYLPATSPTLQLALTAAHGAGHEGVVKTLHCLRADFQVPSTRALVGEFVHVCTTCQQKKAEQLHLASLLQPLEVPSMVWVDIAMDFIEGF
jgi:hypothetical protein